MSTSEDLEGYARSRSEYETDGASLGSADSCDDKLLDLQTRLLECLDNVPSAGSFACFKTEPCAVNPGIYVKDVGVIGLPLAERDARVLIAHSHQSPFGRGTETIIDTSVRKTWELNADQFELRNPAWPPFLQNIVAHVAKELGTDIDVQADLYKLLLYESGGCFKAHKDSEKALGMFGTLVICLPSQHDGGDIKATHAGETKLFSTAPTSMFDQSYIAWYSDVTHEILPVISGVRCCLTYNLIGSAPANVQSATDIQNEKMKLKETLASWTSDGDLPNMQAYMLDHDYTEANLKYNSMKGLDRLRARCLKEMCAETGFCFFLAQMEYAVSGDAIDEDYVSSTERGVAYHPLGEGNEYQEQQQSLELRTVFDLDGRLVARSVPCDGEEIVQPLPFADRGPDDEEWENTGNQGVAAIHFYRDSCALIIKKKYLAEFLSKNSGKDSTEHFTFYIAALSEQYRESPDDPERAAELIYFCNLIVSVFSRCYWRLSSIVLMSAVSASLLVRDEALIEKAMTVYPGGLGENAYTELGGALHGLGPAYLHGKGMNHIISCIATIHRRYRALVAIRVGYCQTQQPDSSVDDMAELEVLIREKVEALLDTENLATGEDAITLLAIYQCYGNHLLFCKILPLMRRQSTTFTTSFLAGLFEQCKQGIGSEDVTSDIFRNLLSELIPIIEIDNEGSRNKSEENMNKRQKTSYLSTPGSRGSESDTEGAPRRVVRGKAVADLLGFCLSLHLQRETAQILQKLEDQRQIAALSAYDDVYFPCLSKLFEFIQPRGRSSETSCFRSVFVGIIKTYRKRFVGEEPTKGTKTEEEWQDEHRPWRNKYSTYQFLVKKLGPIPFLNDFLRKDSQSAEPQGPATSGNPWTGAEPEPIELLD